ncbi:MAG: hypothetical protein LBB19_02935 [Puniceicoccales bacterium]|nr:hypothetical protein [Puniceicoccales bacterium]
MSSFSKGVGIEELFDFPELKLQSLAKALAPYQKIQETLGQIQEAFRQFSSAVQSAKGPIAPQIQEAFQQFSSAIEGLQSAEGLIAPQIQEAFQQFSSAIEGLQSTEDPTQTQIHSFSQQFSRAIERFQSAFPEAQVLTGLIQIPEKTPEKFQVLLKNLAEFQALIKLNEAFNELQKLRSGQRIAKTLQRLLQEKSKEIGNSKIAIEYPLPSSGSISADIKKREQTYKLCLKGVLGINVMQSCHLLGAYQYGTTKGAHIVWKKAIPSHITLGHELLHFIDGLQNLEKYVGTSRTFEDWVSDNENRSRIEALVQYPYFQRIFFGQRNIYEELYVYFGTNASREANIPTENDLLMEAKIGFKIGYSLPVDYFYIEKEVVDNLFAFCGITADTADTITLAQEGDTVFNYRQALQNSPSFIRTQGRCCLTKPTIRAQVDGVSLNTLVKVQSSSTLKGIKAIKNQKDSIEKAYILLADQIDEEYSKLPELILTRPGITQGYRFNPPGPKVSFIFDMLPSPTLARQLFCFEFYGGSKVIDKKATSPFTGSLEVSEILRLTQMPERVHVTFAEDQFDIYFSHPVFQKRSKYKGIFACPPKIKSIPKDTRFIFDFDFEKRPPITAGSPVQTNLGFIDYEQFYNNHKKLLLQVGDGTSLEATIRLYKSISAEFGLDDVSSEIISGDTDFDVIVADLITKGTGSLNALRRMYPKPHFATERDLDGDTIAADVAGTAVNFDDVITEIVTKNSMSPDDFSHYLAPRKHSFVDLDDVFPTFVKPIKIDALGARVDVLKDKLDAKSKIRAIANNTAKQLGVNLRLYLCDTQGREVHRPLLFLYGSPRDRGQPIEIVQDITSIPNVYFLVVDTNSLPPSPVAQKGKSVTPRKRKVPPSPPPAKSSPKTKPTTSTKPGAPKK